MSSVAVPVSSLSRPSAAELRRRVEAELAERIPGALSPHERVAPEMASSGIAALDALTGGWPRGTLTELFGPASAGRTSVLVAALAAATARGEACALIDAGDAFDPESAAAAGVDLKKLLWVRCGKQNPPQRHRDTERKLSHCHSEAKRNAAEETGFQFGNSAVRQFGNVSASLRHRGEDFGMPEPRDIGIWGYGDTETMERINPALARKNPPQRHRGTENDNFLLSHPERAERVEGSLTSRAARIQFGSSALRQFGSPRRTKYGAAYARIEQALKAADLLLGGGGFGLVAFDFAGLPPEAARRVPLATWFRFRRAVETTFTVLLVVNAQPITQSCAALSLKLQPSAVSYQLSAKTLYDCHHEDATASEGSAFPSHAALLTGFRSRAEVVRSPLGRKHPHSAHTELETEAKWA
jgi:recombination protein RecA